MSNPGPTPDIDPADLPASAVAGQALVWNGSAWVAQTIASVDPRAIVEDACAAAGLPTGVAFTGAGAGFDAARKGRSLNGAATYLGPASPQAIPPPHWAECDIEFNNGFATGNFSFGLWDTVAAAWLIKLTFQADGNIVLYGIGGTTPYASGAAKVITGKRYHIELSLSDLQDANDGSDYSIGMLFQDMVRTPVATPTLGNNNAGGIATEAYVGGFNAGGAPSANPLAVSLATDTTRHVTAYRIRHYHGALP